MPLSELRDPQTLAERTKPGKQNWLITLGVCTHLGCVPLGAGEGENRGPYRRLFLPVPRIGLRHRGAHPQRPGADQPGGAGICISRPTPSSRSVEGPDHELFLGQALRTQVAVHELARRAAAAAAPRLRRDRRRLSGAAQPQLFLEFRRPRRALRWSSRSSPASSWRCIIMRRPTGRSIRSSTSCATSTPAGCCATPTPTAPSFFFIVIYIHIFRGLFYGSYKAPREMVWMLGLVIYPADDGDGVHGLRAAVGPDELLGRAGHHRLLLGLPAGRRADPGLAARRLRARPGGADALLLAALSAAVRDRGGGHPPHLGAAHSRVRATRPASTSRTRRTRCRSIRTTPPRTASGSACS